jgi:hypothetical protein
VIGCVSSERICAGGPGSGTGDHALAWFLLVGAGVVEACVARVLELDELVEHFTLLADETALLRNKAGATRLGFALMLKFFVRAGRFPAGRSEFGDEVVQFVFGQVGVPASELGYYD